MRLDQFPTWFSSGSINEQCQLRGAIQKKCGKKKQSIAHENFEMLKCCKIQIPPKLVAAGVEGGHFRGKG